jgi:hypothetical protein
MATLFDQDAGRSGVAAAGASTSLAATMGDVLAVGW